MEKYTRSTETIRATGADLKGELVIPENSSSLVIFAHGSGSSRLSPRNRQVAGYLNNRGIGTFLFDLLSPEEDRIIANRFNIPLLADRLGAVTDAIREKPICKNMRLGYFGASTGSAAALIASASRDIAAIVSRGGRPDLAVGMLGEVRAPVLLIVGELDKEVIRLNEESMRRLNCEKRLEIIPGASHLFEEKGTMEKVAEVSAAWFELFLQPAASKKQ